MAKYKVVNGRWIVEGTEKYAPSLTNRTLYDIENNIKLPKLNSTEKNVDATRDQLSSARNNYNNYIQSQLRDVNSKKINVTRDYRDGFELQNELEQAVSQRYGALKKASNTKKAKKMKKEIVKKQNAYNYAQYQKRIEDVENDKIGFIDKLITPITSGIQNYVDFTRLTNTTSQVDEKGNISYLPTKSDLKYNKVREESGTLGKIYGDVAYNLSQATVAKAIDAITGSPTGSILYYGNIVDDSVQEAKKKGFDDNESLAYGLSTGVVAGVLDKFVSNLGGLTKVSNKIPTLEQGLDKLLFKLTSNKTASVLLSNIGSEGISEFIEEYVDNSLGYVIDSDNMEKESFLDMLLDTLPDASYSFLVGGLSGGVSTGITMNSEETKLRKEALDEYKNKLENIQPQSIPEAKYKNDQLNALDNLYNEMEQTAEEATKKQEDTEKQEEVKQEDKIKNLSDDELETTKKSAELLGYDTKPIEEEQERRKKEREIEKKQDEKFVTDVEKMLFDQTTKEEFNDYWADKFGLKDVDKIISDKKFSTLDDEQLLGLKKSAVLLGYDVDDINSEIQLRKKENRIKQEDLDNFNKETEKMLFEYNDEVTKKTEEYAQMFGLSDNLDNKVKEDKKEISSHTKTIENSIKQKEVQAKQQIKEAKKVNPNLDTNLAEKQVEDVVKISNSLGKKETEKMIDIISPTTKSKEIINLGDNKKYIKTNKEYANIEEFIETVDKSTSVRETKEVELEDRKMRKSFDSLIQKYANEPEKVKILEEMKDNYTYDVRHVGKNILEEQVKILEDDPIDYYTSTMEEYESLANENKLTPSKMKELSEKMAAMMFYFGNPENKEYYDPTMSDAFLKTWAETGTDVAQIMATRSYFMTHFPGGVALRVQQGLRTQYKNDLEKHKNNEKWIAENDPRKNPNSKYSLSAKQKNKIDYDAKQLSLIEDKNSVEYKKAKAQLDNYIQNIYGSFTKSSSVKKLVVLNNLASTRIMMNSAKGNIWQIPQKLLDGLGVVSADKIISNFTGIRTSSVSVMGDITAGAIGFKNGLKDTFYEFKNDITLEKFTNKYMGESGPEFKDLGKKHETFDFNNETPVGKSLNKYGNLIRFGISFSDRPFASMYYERSIYNQRLSVARTNAIKEKTNYIYQVNHNNKTDLYKVSYVDGNGKRHIETMGKNQFNKFQKNSKIQDIIADMCVVAEQEALENTFQDDNAVTRVALNAKKILNKVHIGDFGLGDLTLMFSKTGANMAKCLYEHSPLQTITLIKDIKDLKDNLNYGKTNNTSIDYKFQNKVAKDFGNLLGGMMTTTIMAALVSSKTINVNGKEDDDKEGKFKSKTTGSLPYSVQLGKYNYSFDAGSTFTGLLKVGTDIGKYLEEGNDLLETFFKGTEGMFNEMIEVSFVNNILDITNTQYGDLLDNVNDKLSSLPSRLIPSFLKDISMFVDGFTERQVYDDNPLKYMYNQIIDRTPLRGTEFGLDAKVDSWGELKTIGGDTFASVYNTLISGNTFKRIKSDKVSDEIMNVYTDTLNSDAIPKLSMRENYFKYNKNQYDLTEDEKNSLMKSYAKYSHKAVDDLINLSVYKNATDTDKVKLLQKAYDYADEMSKKDYITSKGEKYYNFDSKNGVYTTYKKPSFEEIIDNNISIEEANYKRKYNNSYKLKTSIIDWETYNEIHDDIKEIQETYSKDNGYDFNTRKQAVQLYIRDLKGLTNVQKAMLSKIENSKGDYSNYDKAIKKYIDTLNLSNEEYEYIYKQLGLGGYWGMYWKSK